MATRNNMRPVHPGEVRGEEYLVPLGMSKTRCTFSAHCRHRFKKKREKL